MKYLLFILLCSHSLFGQIDTCNVCPAGTSKTLTSTFTGSHTWICTDGSTSNTSSITLSPTTNTTCYLTVNDGLCIKHDTTYLKVCNCNNNPCLNMSFNESTDCISFQNVGTINSNITSDVREYKREFQTTWTTVPGSNQLCGCDVRAKISVTPYCFFNTSSGFFNLGYNATICSGTTIAGWKWIPNSGSTVSGSTNQLNDWVSLTPTQLINSGNGGVLTVLNQVSASPLTYAFAKIRFAYTGSGTTCSSITSTVLEQGTYYYDFEARRTVTYSDGCAQTTCNTTLQMPVANTCQVDALLSSINFSSGEPGCPSGNGIGITTYNMTNPITYQWYYNGSPVAPNPAYFTWGRCLVGQPFGEYCCSATDANGCVATSCMFYQGVCNTNVNITLSGTTLTAVPVNCAGTPSYQWQLWNGSAWNTVGTSSTYNTNGVSGDYKVTLSCSGPPACSAINTYTYVNPCNVNLTLSATTTTLNASITGCGGTSITYQWQRWNGTSWSTVATNTTTTTSNSYTPTLSGLYRVNTTCNSCPATAQISFTLPDPCANFTAYINGIFTGLTTGNGYVYSRIISNGTSPYSQTWRLNGTIVGTGTNYTFIPSSPGNYNIQVTVLDANNCSYTDTRNVNVTSSCAINVAVTPSNTSVCTNTSQTFTASSSGGSGSVTYQWTSTITGGSPVNQGTGTTKTLTFSTAGTYTIQVTATDANNCQATTTATINVTNCSSCVCSPSMTLSGCQLIISNTSGLGCSSYSYQLQYSASGTGWSIVTDGTLITNFTYTPTVNGYYRLVLVGLNGTGCGVLEQTIQVNCVVTSCVNQPTLSVTPNNHTICTSTPVTYNGTFSGSATSVSVSHNGFGSVNSNLFNTSPFSLIYTPSASDAGNTVTFTFTTNNPNGAPCVPAVSSTTFNLSNSPSVIITSSNSGLCSGQSRTLTGSPAGGTWSASGPGTLIGNVLTANGSGTISVQYTVNSGGCSGSATQNIISTLTPNTPSYSVNCANSTLTVTNPIGYEYRINSGAWQSSTLFTGITNGSYTLFVRNGICENSTPVTVNCSCANSPTLSLSSISGSTCGTTQKTVSGNTFGGSATNVTATENGFGSLSISSFGSSPFTWTYTPSINDVGNSVIITFTTNNPNGAPCVAASQTYTLQVNSNPTVSITSSNSDICVGSTRLLTATPSGGSFNIVSGQGNVSGSLLSVVGAGSIVISYNYTDVNGCNASATQTINAINIPSIPTASIDCSAGFNNAVLTVTSPVGAGYEYRINSGVWQSGTTFSGLANGSYTIYVRNTTGCQNNNAVTISCGCVNQPVITLSSGIGSTCGTTPKTVSGNTFGGSATNVTAIHTGTGSLSQSSFSSSPFTFTYTPGNGDIGNTITITFTTNNPLGLPCNSSTATYTLAVYSLPSVAITSSSASMCVGATRSLTANPPGGTWVVTSGPGTITGNTLTATGVGSILIQYQYTDVNGCSNQANQQIFGVALPTTPVTTITCGATAVLTVTSPVGAGYEYRINSGAWQSGTTFSSLANGSYVLEVKNSVGCLSSSTININCSCASEPTVTISAPTSITSCGLSAISKSATFGGSATQVVLSHNGSGNLSNNTFSSSPFTFTYTPSSLDIGNTINITATTNNPSGPPCSASSATFVIQVLPLPNPNISGNLTLCAGQSTTLSASGGTSYNWSSGLGVSSSITISPTLTTTYTVSVTGANGCINTASATVIVNPIPTPTFSGLNTQMCVGSTQTLTGNPSGGSFSVISGNAIFAANTLTANGSGIITVQYAVTANGCTGSTSGTTNALASLPTPITTKTCSNGVGSITVTSPTGSQYRYRVDGGTWQAGTTFSGLSQGNHIVEVRYLIDVCPYSSTTVNISCECNCSASITSNNCTLSLNVTECVNWAWVWQESTDGVNYNNVQTGGTTYTGQHNKYYRVAYWYLTCTGFLTNVIQLNCGCSGLSMSVTTSPGSVSFGTLNYNGSPINNYRIEWRKCSDNSVVFTSGMGSGSGSGIYSHPFSNLPLSAGCYYPYIVFSPQGNNLNCFQQFTVNNWNCGGVLNYSYNGPGGSAATREFQMDINNTITGIKIWGYYVSTVPDLLEVIYNGVVIKTTSSSGDIFVPINYVSGQNVVTFRITNTNSNVNTLWQIADVTCCTGNQPCPTSNDVGTITSVSSSLDANTCGCLMSFTKSLPTHQCRDCENVYDPANIQYGACLKSITNFNQTCTNENITVTGTGSTINMVFNSLSIYTTIKNYIIATPANEHVSLNLNQYPCGNDGYIRSISFIPSQSVLSYNDATKTITITISVTNPYPTTCVNCDNTKRYYYNQYYNQFISQQSNGNYQAISNYSRSAIIQTPVSNDTHDIGIYCYSDPCDDVLARNYKIIFRNTQCPCQSWQVYEDVNTNGINEPSELRFEAPGWTGSCN